jgi:hypothetical protein
MNRLLGLTMGAAALSLSVLVAAPTKQKLEKVDLSQMKDGETRTLGQGDHVLTATRKGDVITINFGEGDGEKRSLKCNVGKDSCYAMTTSGDGEGKIVVLNKSGKAGKDISPVIVHSGNDEDGNFVFATTEGGDGAEIIVDAAGDGMSWITSDDDGLLPGMKLLYAQGDGGAVLHCPEGDATLTLKKGEEDSGPYFCPKHNLKMEKFKGHTFMKKIVVSTDDKEKEKEE